MSIEDRSLDALKEEGTATVIDGSDGEWDGRGALRLYSVNDQGQVSGHYLYAKKIKDGKEEKTILRADGTRDNEATLFKLHIAEEGKDQIVILQHSKTEEVVAIDAKKNDVITKGPPAEASEMSNLDIKTLKENQSEILFLKRQKAVGSKLFYLESFLRDKQRVLGFEDDGSLKKPTDVVRGSPESLLEIHLIESSNT